MFRPKIIAFVIAIYAVGAFLFGANFDEIIKKQTNNQLTSINQSPLLTQAIYTLVIGFLGFGIVPLFENWLADESKKKAEEEAQKKIQTQYLSIFTKQYSKEINQAINRIKKSNFYVQQPEIAEEVCNSLTEIIDAEEIEALIYDYKVAQDVARILHDSNKRNQLTKKAVAHAIKNNPNLDKKYHKKFSEDIFYSLGWLCLHLKEFTVSELTEEDENKLTSAIKDGIASIKPYEDALNFIKNENDLNKSGSPKTEVIEYYVDYLIEQLSKTKV